MEKNSIAARIFYFLTLGLLLGSCTTYQMAQSNWQVHKPKLDELYDVNRDSAHILGEQNVLYTVSNDSTNLYIKLMIADHTTQRQIMKNGMSIWIDTSGGKKQLIGIQYPLPAKENKTLPELGEENKGTSTYDKASRREMQKRIILSMVEMDLTGFGSYETVRVPAYNPAGPGVSLMIDSFGTLQYKAVIPFKSFRYDPKAHTGKKANPFSLGLILNKPEEKGGRYGGAGSHGGSFGNGGGMPGGGMPGGGGMGGGGRHGGGRGGEQSMDSEPGFDVWVHVKFAER